MDLEQFYTIGSIANAYFKKHDVFKYSMRVSGVLR